MFCPIYISDKYSVGLYLSWIMSDFGHYHLESLGKHLVPILVPRFHTGLGWGLPIPDD